MAAFAFIRPTRPIDERDAAIAPPGGGRSLAVPALIAGTWVTVLVAQATGAAAGLHHHALIEGGLPPWIAIALFLVGWLVMVAAMMLPASLPTIRIVEAAARRLARPRRARAAFLAAFAATWTAFGLLAFTGDIVLHHLVDATPWLAARPWLVEAGVLALAGGYQLMPLKRRSLAACRHPDDLVATATPDELHPARLGLRHGLACLGSSWALMLLMFAEGFASVWWMVALAVLMVYEATGRRADRVAVAAGIVLLAVAVAASWGLLPAVA